MLPPIWIYRLEAFGGLEILAAQFLDQRRRKLEFPPVESLDCRAHGRPGLCFPQKPAELGINFRLVRFFEVLQ